MTRTWAVWDWGTACPGLPRYSAVVIDPHDVATATDRHLVVGELTQRQANALAARFNSEDDSDQGAAPREAGAQRPSTPNPIEPILSPSP